MIETIDDNDYKKFQLVIHDSLEMRETRIDFENKSRGLMYYSECKTSFAKLSESIKNLFPRSYEKKWKDSYLSGNQGNKSFNSTWVMGLIRRFAVYENYQITNYRERKASYDDVLFQTLFIYKPD